MIELREDSVFKKEVLVKLANDIYRYKKQRQGAEYGIKQMSKNFNFEKSKLEEKLVESSIVLGNKWSSLINKKEPIKVLCSQGHIYDEIFFKDSVKDKDISSELRVEQNSFDFENPLYIENSVKEIFNYWYKVFPSKRKINKDRKSILTSYLEKGYKVEDFKKAIDSVNFRIECDHRPGEKRYDDICNIFNSKTFDNNIKKYDERKKKYEMKNLEVKNSKDLGSTAISKIIKDFTNQYRHGVLEMKCPTGFGKTYSAIVFMQDFIRYDNSKKIVVFISKQKTNLEEPLRDLEKHLTKEEKNKIFRVLSQVDLYEFISLNSSAVNSLISKLKGIDNKNRIKKSVDSISYNYRGNNLNQEQLNTLCEKDFSIIKNAIVMGLKEDVYLNNLTNEEKNVVYNFFPLNKIEEGGCKIVGTTINKANVASHKLIFNSNGDAIKKSDILFKLKSGNSRKNRTNDIFIIDESQNFVPTVNEAIVNNAIEFNVLNLIKALHDRYQNDHPYTDSLSRRLILSGVDKRIIDFYTEYKLNNGVDFLGGEKDIYKYNYLIDANKIVPLRGANNVFYKIEEKGKRNNIYFSEKTCGGEVFTKFLNKVKDLIFDFNKKVEVSYQKYLTDLESEGKISQIKNPIESFIVKMHLDHADFKSYIYNLLETYAPHKKEKDDVGGNYEELKNKNYILTLKSGEGFSANLSFLVGEKDANNNLITLAKANKVIFLSGTADASTVIGNNHIDFIKEELRADEKNFIYKELNVEEQDLIYKEFNNRNKFIDSIERKVIGYEVANSSEDDWFKEFNYVVDKLKLSKKNADEFKKNMSLITDSYQKSRLVEYFKVVSDFLLNDNHQIMLSCHSKFNYQDLFSKNNERGSALEKCLNFLIKNTKYLEDNDIKVSVKSFNSLGYREHIKSNDELYLNSGEKYIFIGTTSAIGQGANISVKIESKEKAEKMGYISTRGEIGGDNINACIDTLFIENPTYLLGLTERGSIKDEQYKLAYLMKLNLLSAGNIYFTDKEKNELLKLIDKDGVFNAKYKNMNDYDNNIDAIIKQIVGRIPRSDVFKKEIKIFLDKDCLKGVYSAKQKNIDFNTLEYKEVYKYASKIKKDNEIKGKNINTLKIQKLNNEFDKIQRDKISTIQKLKLSKNKEALNNAISRRNKFIKASLSSIGGKEDAPFGLYKYYNFFDNERYFYKKEGDKVSCITNEKQTGSSYFDYGLLNGDLFCQITGTNKSQFPELCEGFNAKYLPVPSLARFIIGFRAEEYAEIMFKNRGYKVYKPNPIIEEDADFIVENVFGQFAIDIKNSESKDYDSNQSLGNKIRRVKEHLPNSHYVVLDLWGNGDGESELIDKEVSRFNGLLDKEGKKDNFINFELFLKQVSDLGETK